MGVTYRWTDASSSGLVIHEGYYGLFWKERLVSKTHIAAVERYDRLRKGVFAQNWCSGIRVRIAGNGDIVITESDGAGKYRQEAEQMRRALDFPESGQDAGLGSPA